MNQNKTETNQNAKGEVKPDPGSGKTDEEQITNAKETKKERQERISKAKADMYPDDSPDSGSLTPVEADVLKRRKRKRQSFDTGNQSYIQAVKQSNNNATESQQKDKKVSFY